MRICGLLRHGVMDGLGGPAATPILSLDSRYECPAVGGNPLPCPLMEIQSPRPTWDCNLYGS